MTEPRMRARQKGQQFATADLEALLIAFGDSPPPLPATIRVLDEIITDFIIETCHLASVSAQTSHRAKIKVDDFKFALRKDPKKLGRVTELLALDKDIKRRRKAFEVDEEAVAKEGGTGRGRGRRPKGDALVDEEEDVDDIGERRGAKRGRKPKRQKVSVKAAADDETSDAS